MMRLTVKSMQDMVVVTVPASGTVLDIKRCIEDQKGIDPARQKIILAGDCVRVISLRSNRA